MDNRRRAVTNILVSILSYGVSIVVGLLLPRLFAYTYGSETNGLISSINQFVVYLSLFEAGVGSATLQALYKPVAEDDKAGVSSIMRATYEYYRKAGFFYLIGLLALCFIYPLVVSIEMPYWKALGIIFFIGFGNVLNFWLQGRYVILLEVEGEKYITTYLVMLSTILTGIAKIVLISFHVDVLYILALSFLINVLSMAYILFYIKKHYQWLDKKAKANYEAIGQKNYVLIHQISSLIFSNTDIIILTVFCGLKVVSVYSMYKLVVSQLGQFIAILPNSVSFSLGQSFQTDLQLYKRQVDDLESAYSVLFHTIFSVCLFLFLPFMRLYTAGITDINYVDYQLAVLFVMIELLSAARIPMNNTIGYAGHFKATTSRTIIESVLNLGTSLVAVYFLGIYGVLMGTIVALLYRTNDIILYANHRLLKRKAGKTYLIHGINLVILVFMQFIYIRLFPSIDSYGLFIVAGFVTAAITGAVMLLVQMAIFKDFRRCVRWFSSLVLSKVLRRNINYENPYSL